MRLNYLVKKILHVVSVLGVFLIIFGSLSLLQMYTVGILFELNALVFHGIPINTIIYSIVSLIIIKKFLVISSPYK